MLFVQLIAPILTLFQGNNYSAWSCFGACYAFAWKWPFSVTRAKLLDDLIVAFGGRAAEELIFGYDRVTTGASSDIQQTTNIARAMVTKWGLSDKIGAVDYGEDDSSKFYAANKPHE